MLDQIVCVLAGNSISSLLWKTAVITVVIEAIVPVYE